MIELQLKIEFYQENRIVEFVSKPSIGIYYLPVELLLHKYKVLYFTEDMCIEKGICYFVYFILYKLK